LSITCGPEFHRKGYGKEALRLLLDSGFSRYNLHSIYGETFERNPAAKMFIDLGMQCTGVHHAAYYREGAYVDAYVYSILEHEWRLGKSVCPVVKMTKKKKETMS
jgi:RimJ/RimL family protein N-acetyltransferase